jgi:hypothetical protein
MVTLTLVATRYSLSPIRQFCEAPSVSTALLSDSSTETRKKDSVVGALGHRDDGQCAVPLLRGCRRQACELLRSSISDGEAGETLLNRDNGGNRLPSA